MASSRLIDNCPLCGEPNSHANVDCRHCGYELPWATAAKEAAYSQVPVKREEEPLLDRILRCWGLLPTRTLACCYCNGPFEVDTKHCPHCQRWPVSWGVSDG